MQSFAAIKPIAKRMQDRFRAGLMAFRAGEAIPSSNDVEWLKGWQYGRSSATLVRAIENARTDQAWQDGLAEIGRKFPRYPLGLLTRKH